MAKEIAQQLNADPEIIFEGQENIVQPTLPLLLHSWYEPT